MLMEKYLIDEREIEPALPLPEQNLCIAVIDRAIRDIIKPGLNQGNDSMDESARRKRAFQWFFSSEEDTYSFRWICDHLPGDPYCRMTYYQKLVRKLGKDWNLSE